MYTLNTTHKAQILVLFAKRPAVSKYRTFYNSPLPTMLNKKAQNLEFQISQFF